MVVMSKEYYRGVTIVLRSCSQLNDVRGVKSRVFLTIFILDRQTVAYKGEGWEKPRSHVVPQACHRAPKSRQQVRYIVEYNLHRHYME